MNRPPECLWMQDPACADLRAAAAPPGADTEGYVEAVETCGAVDGPGLRYVVFTKGCPLRCQYCHNPETQGRPRGEATTAGKVLEDVLRYKAFLRRGGLTISGGEPLMQPEFIHALAHGAKAAGLHTALDTSGFLGRRATEAMLQDIDLVILDIKSGLSETHKAVTGVDLQPTLEFAQRLESLGVAMWIRFVLVPGLTDAPENIAAMAQFIAPFKHVERVEILPFHKMGELKYTNSGMPYQLTETPSPSAEQVAGAKAIFARFGVLAH